MHGTLGNTHGGRYGAAKLSGIDPVHYKALLADAEVLTDAT